MYFKSALIFLAASLILCVGHVYAQFGPTQQPGGFMPGGRSGPPFTNMGGRPAWGDRSGGDRSGGDRRGGDRRGGDRGSRDRGGATGRGGGGDRFGRMEGFLRGMDTNGDGVIQESEVPEERRMMFRAISQRMGFDPAKGVSIQGVRAAVESRGREMGGPGQGSAPWQFVPPQVEEPLVPGFGDDQPPQLASAFGVRVEPTTGLRFSPEKKLDPRVEAAMKWLDRNNNGVLERDEWRRLPGNPMEIDQNRDGKITAEELADFMARQQRRGGQGDNSRNDGRDEEKDEWDGKSFVSYGEGSYRFRSAHERLPSGLPGWFVDRDIDRDGQVTMAEYSRTWNDSTFKEFARYDRNNDGVITAAEALNPAEGKSVGPPATDAQGGSSDASGRGPSNEGASEAPAVGGGSTPWWME